MQNQTTCVYMQTQLKSAESQQNNLGYLQAKLLRSSSVCSALLGPLVSQISAQSFLFPMQPLSDEETSERVCLL